MIALPASLTGPSGGSWCRSRRLSRSLCALSGRPTSRYTRESQRPLLDPSPLINLGWLLFVSLCARPSGFSGHSYGPQFCSSYSPQCCTFIQHSYKGGKLIYCQCGGQTFFQVALSNLCDPRPGACMYSAGARPLLINFNNKINSAAGDGGRHRLHAQPSPSRGRPGAHTEKETGGTGLLCAQV